MENRTWTLEQLEPANEQLERASPREILAWSLDTFAPDIALATSFGPSDILLAHILSQLDPEVFVFYLDTGLFFPETHALRERLEEKLGVGAARILPDLDLGEQERRYGAALWTSAPDRCCHFRKVVPLRRVLSTRKAWITGLRRDQSPTRAGARIVEWDAGNGLVKINPLAHWTHEDVWSYLRLHELPYNELHDRNYPSIGCMPCTQPVPDGADSRSGRWAGSRKTECGIHLSHPESS